MESGQEQQELQQWAQAAKQKDEDSIALQSYTKSDNTRMKELYLESEKAACALTNLERELDTEVTSTQSAQIQLDRTAQALRENHIERQKLIKLWENAVDAIQKRDDSIHKAAEDFASNKTRIRRKKQELDKLAKVVEKESENTMQLKKRIEIDEEEVIEMRELCREEMSSTKEAEEQLDSLKCKAHRAYADLSGLLVQKEKASEELNLKNTKLEKMEKKLASLRKKVHEESCLLDTLEKKESKLEKMYLLDDKNLKLVQKLVNDLREKHFQTSAKLHASQEKEKDITYEINGAKSQARVLSTQIRQLEMTMIKQEEVLYAAEFQIQCLERKVARASGERSDLETREFNSKILLLEKELEEKKNEEVTISTQLKKSEDHHRSVKRNKEELQKQVTQMEERNAELMLESETGLHALKALVKDKEEKMLARDLLQMEVNRLQEILFLKEDSVHGMECTRERLEKSMEERKDEIESHREKQRLELRALQEDLHFLMMKRKKLALSVEKLQAKYEVVLKRVKVEGEEHSFNYYIIKAAQERQTLQQEGYKLEQEVKQVQEDVSALEVAIQELRYANNLLRHSYKSTQCIELEDEQSILKESLKRAFECLQHKEAKYNSLLQEIAETESRIENAEKERISVAVTLKDLQSKLDTARKEDDEQSLKQKRSKLQLEKLSKDLKDTLG
ncbi:hypothetical protein O6H91_06G039000 [Diphasiastrum complanatum]|nr:hypothetical protein O6H91_06G039000 [Diphasiastrum complanatum]